MDKKSVISKSKLILIYLVFPCALMAIDPVLSQTCRYYTPIRFQKPAVLMLNRKIIFIGSEWFHSVWGHRWLHILKNKDVGLYGKPQRGISPLAKSQRQTSCLPDKTGQASSIHRSPDINSLQANWKLDHIYIWEHMIACCVCLFFIWKTQGIPFRRLIHAYSKYKVFW